jgi:hypothetical protein
MTITDTAPAASLAVPYNAIPQREVHWFWKGFIPFRHVTLVVGQGGTSKGILTVELGARMTRHDPAPGEPEPSYAGPMDIILIAPEDDPNEAVRGRLEAAGAVLDRVHNLTIFPDGQPFTVPSDIPALTQAINEIEYAKDEEGQRTIARIAEDGKPHKVGMVILDPLLALATDPLTNRGKARPVMEALEQTAKDHHLVIMLTHHTNADGKAAGSRAIVETVRNVLTLGKLPKAPEDSTVRLLAVTKTNIGLTGAVQRYALTGPVEATQVVWSCEAPPEDVSRGYDVSLAGEPVQPAEAAGKPVKAKCCHSWPRCGNCPLRAAGKHAASVQISDPEAANYLPRTSTRTARPPYMGIPLSERYRASYLVGDAKPLVIDDYETPEQARHACALRSPSLLNWQPIDAQPGLQGAGSTDRAAGVTTYYAVLDRYAKAATQAGPAKAA